MGTILCSRIELITTISETIGYKSGLALSRNEIIGRLPDYKDYFSGNDEDGLRIKSDVFEGMILELLHKIGNIPSPKSTPIILELYQKYSDKPAHQELLVKIIELFNGYLSKNQKKNQATDLNPFMQSVFDKFGAGVPIQIALDYIQAVQFTSYLIPWSNTRYIDWKDTVELQKLFKSESLSTYYGNFFDQRFVDYLYKNFDDIDKIHWRQFEGLTAEFYTREGFHVNLGPGRDDGSIDARVFPTKDDTNKPPLILIQCKREKKKVEKVIVKALWADMYEEKVESGLIVTTNALSPGAEQVCTARNYQIQIADRKTLREWILKMRSPYTEVFLGK